MNREELIERLEAREAEFQELVEAAVNWHKAMPQIASCRDYHEEEISLGKAVQPFLPEPKLSEKLRKLSMNDTSGLQAELFQLAKEAEALEGKG